MDHRPLAKLNPVATSFIHCKANFFVEKQSVLHRSVDPSVANMEPLYLKFAAVAGVLGSRHANVGTTCRKWEYA